MMKTGMASADYFDVDALSASKISRIAQRGSDIDPHTETPDMIVGRAIHKALLENAFRDEFAIFFGTRRGRKWADFKQRHWGKTLLTADEFRLVKQVVRSLRGHPGMQEDIKNGITEVSFFADGACPVTGKKYRKKCRVDLLNRTTNHGIVITDIKTTISIDENALNKTIMSFRYYMAAAWYADIVENHFGTRPAYRLIFAEKRYPFQTREVWMPEDVLQWGRAEYEQEVARYFSKKTPQPEQIVFELPEWKKQQIDEKRQWEI